MIKTKQKQQLEQKPEPTHKLPPQNTEQNHNIKTKSLNASFMHLFSAFQWKSLKQSGPKVVGEWKYAKEPRKVTGTQFMQKAWKPKRYRVN